ncbi:hypothetical protein Vretifemale_6939, partial [Volvox reticuliferus]
MCTPLSPGVTPRLLHGPGSRISSGDALSCLSAEVLPLLLLSPPPPLPPPLALCVLRSASTNSVVRWPMNECPVTAVMLPPLKGGVAAAAVPAAAAAPMARMLTVRLLVQLCKTALPIP